MHFLHHLMCLNQMWYYDGGPCDCWEWDCALMSTLLVCIMLWFFCVTTSTAALGDCHSNSAVTVFNPIFILHTFYYYCNASRSGFVYRGH